MVNSYVSGKKTNRLSIRKERLSGWKLDDMPAKRFFAGAFCIWQGLFKNGLRGDKVLLSVMSSCLHNSKGERFNGT